MSHFAKIPNQGKGIKLINKRTDKHLIPEIIVRS
jgi:hypothetical protein